MDKFRAVLVVLGAAVLVLLPAATASHTPAPLTVTVAGSLQSEAGCPDDWVPACAATHLAYDASDDVWQGTFTLPAGNYEYKAALNDAWTENYGLHAQSDGANIPLTLPSGAAVKFYYDHESHWATDNRKLGDRRRAGELPVRTRLPDRLGSHLPTLVARGPRRRRHLHLRDHRTACRLVRDEGRDQRGLGRELRPGWRPQRLEHPVQRPRRQHEGDVQLRRCVPRADGDRRDARRCSRLARRALALRSGPQGLPRHRPQLDLEGLVHGRERRPQRRLLPDDRQHERRDAPVRRHRRLDVHRPPDARHDLRRRGDSRDRRHGLPSDRDEPRAASTRSRRTTSPIRPGTRC